MKKIPSEQSCGVFDGLIEDQFVLCNHKVKSDDKTHSISFNSESISNLANSFADYFEHGTKLNSVVGLVGHYGCGKTSFCRFLEYMLSKKQADMSNDRASSPDKKYFFFFYDLWKHHNENLKKSIISELTSYLLENDVLEEHGGKNNKSDKLLFWMSRHHVGCKRNFSRVSFIKLLTIPFIISIFFLALKDVFNLRSLFNCIAGWFNDPLNRVFLFFLVSIVYLFCLNLFYECLPFRNFFNSLISRVFTYKHLVYSEDSCNSDLSVSDFQKWIMEIYCNLKPNWNVVIVLDNLDRLPNDMIKDLFSSIHDLFFILNSSKFTEDSEITSRIHVLIPFEYNSIYNVFEGYLEKTEFQDDCSYDRNDNDSVQNYQKNKTVSKNINQEGITKENDNLKNKKRKQSECFLNYTEDFLDKTFSVIFYLPHFNPYSFRDLFEHKLDCIVENWFCLIKKHFDDNSNLLNEWAENYSALNEEIDNFNNDLNKVKSKTFNYCWSMFVRKKDFNSLSIRKMLSYLRQINLLLCLNYKNLLFENCSKLNKILLYVAFFSVNISTFRKYSLALALKSLKESWKEDKYGIIPKASDLSYESQYEINAEEYYFFTYVQIIYYQASLKSISYDAVYLQLLIDGIKFKNTSLVKFKLSEEYFKKYSDKVIGTLLEIFNDLDNPIYLDNFIEILGELLEKNGGDKLDSRLLQNKERFYDDRSKKNYSVIKQNAIDRALIKVWENVFCLLFQHVWIETYRQHFYSRNYYIFLKNIFSKYFSSSCLFLFALVSYIKNILHIKFISTLDLNVVSDMIYYLKELSNLEEIAVRNSHSIASINAENLINTHFEKDFFNKLSVNYNESIIIERNTIHRNNYNDSSLRCICLLYSGSINNFINVLVGNSDMLEQFEQLGISIVFKYFFDKSPDPIIVNNWNLTVSKETRLFLCKYVEYFEDNKYDLKDIFIDVFKVNAVLKNKLSSIDAYEKYILIKYFYKYALLCSIYKHKENILYEDIYKRLNIQFTVITESVPEFNQEKAKNLSPFIRFIILYYPLEKLDLAGCKDYIDKTYLESFTSSNHSLLKNLDPSDKSLPELRSCLSALIIIKSYIFDKTIPQGITKGIDYSDLKFFLEAFLYDKKIIEDCLSSIIDPAEY